MDTCEDAGAFADGVVASAERLVRIPDAMGLDVAAVFPIQALTASHLVHHVGVPRPGDRAGSDRLNRFPRTVSGVLPRLTSLPHRGWDGGRV